MVTLIIPAARDGPDFLDGRPVWLAQLPQGQLALQQILTDLDCSNVSRIVFVTLKAHIERYCGGTSDTIRTLITHTLTAKINKEKLLLRKYIPSQTLGTANAHDPSTTQLQTGSSVQAYPPPKVTIIALETSPASAPETVCIAIEEAAIQGPIFVKDSDGSFVHTIVDGNYVCGLCLASLSTTQGGVTVNIETSQNSAAGTSGMLDGSLLTMQEGLETMSIQGLLSKSFIERTGVLLTNLVEKKLVSDTIAVGGYGFRSAEVFARAAHKAEFIKSKITHALTNETSSSSPPARVFVSNIVQQLLFENVAFTVSLTTALSDWKSLASWNAYKATFKNFFVALEGSLFSPSSESKNIILSTTDVSLLVPLEDRIDRLVKLKVSYGSRCKIIITSREPECSELAVRKLLDEHGVPFDSVLFGVPTATAHIL